MSIAGRLLDFLWPRAEKDEALNPPALFQTYANAITAVAAVQDDPIRKKILDLSQKVFDYEEQKRQSILTRSGPTLTTAGLGLALFGGLLSLLGQQSTGINGPWAVLVWILMLASLVYFLGSVIAVLQVHGRIPRYSLGPDDLVPAPNQDEGAYDLSVGVTLLRYTVNNYKAENRATALVFASQKRLRNGLLFLAAAVVLVLCTYTMNRLNPQAPDTPSQTRAWRIW